MTEFALVLALAVVLFNIWFWARRIQEIIDASRMVPEIDPGRRTQLAANPPFISVIVPARNEQAVIRGCLLSVLEQDYPRVELILVDDRSQDRTVSIAESLVPGGDNFRIISVQEAPHGWTGKCHALHVGVRHASGEWLAFLDADCRLDKTALRECYTEAVAADVSVLTLSPKFLMGTFWEKALQPAFAAMSCILFPLGRINDASSTVASANGMFYIISRSAYEQIGGHQAVKGLAVEDIGIGKRVKASGLGLIFANGKQVLQTRMYNGFGETLRGWTRILSASMNYQLPTVIKYLMVHVLVSLPMLVTALWIYISQTIGLFPNAWYILPGVCLLAMCIAPPLFCIQLGVPKRYSLLLILGNLMLIWVFLIIFKKILLNESLQWRGRTYRFNRYQPAMLDPAPE